MPTDPIDRLALEAKLSAQFRELLAPHLTALRNEFAPIVADAAVVVVFESDGIRQPVVMSTNRDRISRDLEAWAAKVRAEAPHDRGARG